MATIDHILRRIGAKLSQNQVTAPYRAPAIAELATHIQSALAARPSAAPPAVMDRRSGL